MGVLGNQPPRKTQEISERYLDGFLEEAVKLSKKHNIAVSDVIAAKKALEIERRNCLYLENGDNFDEQMGGLGAVLQQIANALEQMKR